MVSHKRMEKWWLALYMHVMMYIKLIKFDVHTCQNDCETSGWLADIHTLHLSSSGLFTKYLFLFFFKFNFFSFFLLTVLHIKAVETVAAKQTVLDARKRFKPKISSCTMPVNMPCNIFVSLLGRQIFYAF